MKHQHLVILFFIFLGLNYQCSVDNIEPVPQDDGPQIEGVQVNNELANTSYRGQPPVFASDNIEITDSLTTVTIQKIAQSTEEYVSLVFSSELPPSDWTFPLLFDANPAAGNTNNLRLFKESHSTPLHILTCRDSLHTESLGCNMQLWVTSYDEATKKISGNFEGTGNAPYACPTATCPDPLYQMEVSGSFSVFVDR